MRDRSAATDSPRCAPPAPAVPPRAPAVHHAHPDAGLHLLGGLLSGNGNVLVPSLVGVGLIAGVLGIGSLLALLLGSGLGMLGRYVRLNYRLLKPEDQGEEE